MTAVAQKIRTRTSQPKPRHLKVVEQQRNKRVRKRPRGWAKKRMSKLEASIAFADAASAHRRVMQVTLEEMGKAFNVTMQAAGYWESGMYMGWTEKSLVEYQRVCTRIAQS